MTTDAAETDTAARTLDTAIAWAICPRCEQPMAPGGTCDESPWRQDGREIPPIPYGSEVPPFADPVCHDCNAGPGQSHHYGCDVEQCPHANQAITCDDCPVLDEDPYWMPLDDAGEAV